MTSATDNEPVTREEKLEVLSLLTASEGPFDDHSGPATLLQKLLKMDIAGRPDADFHKGALAKSLHVSGNQIAVWMTHIRKLLRARYSGGNVADIAGVSFPRKSYRPEFQRRGASPTIQRLKFAIESWNGPRVWKEVIEPCEQKRKRGSASVIELSCLAAALIQAGYWGDRPGDGLREQAISAAQTAVADLAFVDSNEIASIAYLGHACVSAVFQHDFASAESGFLKAIKKSPTNPFARAAYATNVLSPARRLEEAVRHAKIALDNDPKSPFTNSALAWMYFYSDRYSLAVKHWQDALYFFSDGFSPKYGLACVYGETKNWNKCFDTFDEILETWPGQPYITALMAHYKACSKDHQAARKMLRSLTDAGTSEYVSPYGLALIHGGLGENDLAFELLDEAEQEWDVRLTYFDIAPAWRPLRKDVRYKKLGQRLGLPQFQKGVRNRE